MQGNYHIKTIEEYEEAYAASLENPEDFWAAIAAENFVWKKPWSEVLSWNFNTPEVKWFDGAELNITENCIDRHLGTRADKTAILFEPNDPSSPAEHISYKELHERVCKFANVLKAQGIEKGDRVCIYLPMALIWASSRK